MRTLQNNLHSTSMHSKLFQDPFLSNFRAFHACGQLHRNIEEIIIFIKPSNKNPFCNPQRPRESYCIFSKMPFINKYVPLFSFLANDKKLSAVVARKLKIFPALLNDLKHSFKESKIKIRK